MGMYDTQAPYIASYLIVQNDEGKVAFVMRKNTSWMNGYYGLPSGKVEKGESFTAAVIREGKEEIGIDIDPLDLEHALTVHRNSIEDNNENMEWVDVYFVVNKWTGEPVNAEPHIHSSLDWLDVDNMPDNVVPSLAESLKAWKSGKTLFEHGW